MRGTEQLRAFRQRVRSTRTGRVAFRIVIGIIGAGLCFLGLILVPLPGPGWLIVLAGLAILSIEFTWAQRLLTFTRTKLEAWWHWLGRQHWSVRVVAGLVGLVFVGGVAAFSLFYGFGVPSPLD